MRPVAAVASRQIRIELVQNDSVGLFEPARALQIIIDYPVIPIEHDLMDVLLGVGLQGPNSSLDVWSTMEIHPIIL